MLEHSPRFLHRRCFFPLAFFVFLSLSLAFASHAADRGLDIYWVDVEGGAATLIVTPQRETILIDSGNPGHRDPDRIVKVVTQVAGLRRIDHLITTHYHRDHYGGASTLATLLPIGTVHDNGIFDGMPESPGKAYFEFQAETRNVISAGDTMRLKQSDAGPRLTLQCLAARKQFMEPPPDAPENHQVLKLHRDKDRDGSDNANSVVMLLSYGPFRFFDGGDITWNQELHLVHPKNLVGVVDVYQVSHHGLDSSNNPVVVRSLQPTVAVMNNGVTKGCMPEVFETLTGAPSIEAIFQVHKNQRPDGVKNNVSQEQIANHSDQCNGNYIHLSVAPDGETYTVHIPANNYNRTFKTKAK